MKKFENIVAFIVVSVFALIGFVTASSPNSTVTMVKDGVEIHFLDVGQGDSVLVQKESSQTLIDGGPDGAVLTELGEHMPIGDRRIETLILTHPHADHLRGLNYVLRDYQVEKVYFSGVSYNTPEFQQFMATIKDKGIPTERLYRGKNLLLEEVSFKVLWPTKDLSGVGDINDTSVVIDLSYAQSEVLLLGDVSTRAQLEFFNSLHPVDILKVSHHGSKTGTDLKLIEATDPAYSVIEVGKNSYGHPTPTVLALLRGSHILRTDRDGTISFALNKDGALLY